MLMSRRIADLSRRHARSTCRLLGVCENHRLYCVAAATAAVSATPSASAAPQDCIAAPAPSSEARRGVSAQLLQSLHSTFSSIPKEVHLVASTLLSDDAAEEASTSGGLLSVLRSLPDEFAVSVNDKGLFTAVARGGKALAVEQDLLSELQLHVPCGVYRPLSEIYDALSPSGREGVRLHRSLALLLGKCTTLFRLSRDRCHVTARDASGDAPAHTDDEGDAAAVEELFDIAAAAGDAVLAPDATPFGHLPPAPSGVDTSLPSLENPFQTVQYTAATRTILDYVSAVLPSFFVPLIELEKNIPSEAGIPPGKLFDALEGVSGQDVDLRIVGDRREDAFVRFIGANFATGPSERGAEIFASYSPFPHAKALHAALLEYALRQQKNGWVGIDELSTALPAPLFSALPLQGAAAILVFDRLQHLFEVDTEAYRVRPRRGIVGGDGSELDFNFRTTPVPRSVRFVLATVRRPTPLHMIQETLPAAIVKELSTAFPSFSHFVGAHRLFMFLRRDSELWTSSMMHRALAREKASSRGGDFGGRGGGRGGRFGSRGRGGGRSSSRDGFGGGNVRPASDDEVRVAILHVLPSDSACGFRGLLNKCSPEVQAAVPSGAFPARSYLKRFDRYFRCYDVQFSTNFVVQRSDLPPPLNAAEDITSEAELMRYMLSQTAPFNATERATLASLIQRVSLQAKSFLRAMKIFSVLQFLEAHPSVWRLDRAAHGDRNLTVVHCLVPAPPEATAPPGRIGFGGDRSFGGRGRDGGGGRGRGRGFGGGGRGFGGGGRGERGFGEGGFRGRGGDGGRGRGFSGGRR